MNTETGSVQNKYKDSFMRRMKVVIECGEKDNKGTYTQKALEAQAVQLSLCARDPVYFLETFCQTYSPKEAGSGGLAFVPFDPWPRQKEFLRWLDGLVRTRREGLCEKARDVGATFMCAGYATNRWLFVPGFKTTFGSRKLDLVDKLGDPDSIMEKVRLMLYRLPEWMRPPGFSREKHDNWTKITNPHNDAVISGEAGDNMGRGGRSTLYCIDEGAFIDRAEVVAAAVIANADSRLWLSSPNGPGNLFARKRHDGSLEKDQIFTLSYNTDPSRDESWLAKKRKELSTSLHIFYSEYLIDYNASVEGICIPSAWIHAAIELGKRIPINKSDYPGIAGLDIGAGVAESCFIARYGPLITPPICWSAPDTTETAYAALEAAQKADCHTLNFDTIGVGKGVLSTMTHRQTEDYVDEKGVARTRPRGLKVVPVNVGSPASWTVRWADNRSSRQKFANLRAELWAGHMYERFRCTAEHLAFLTGDPIGSVLPQQHDIDECAIFEPADGDPYRELIVQISTPKRLFNAVGKVVLESKQQLSARGVASPDRADSLCFVAGTKIKTPAGDKNIEELNIGDLVLTPFGPTPVVKTWLSQTSRITKVVLSNGSVLEGRPEHEIFVWGVGRTRLSDLTLFSCVEPYTKCRSFLWRIVFTMMGPNIGFKHLVDTLSREKQLTARDFFIVGCGQIISALYQKSVTYITQITTGVTTIFPTWNALAAQSIGLNTLQSYGKTKPIELPVLLGQKKALQPPRNESFPKKSLKVVEFTVKRYGKISFLLKRYAKFAERLFWPNSKENAFVPQPVPKLKFFETKDILQRLRHVIFAKRNSWLTDIIPQGVVPLSVEVNSCSETDVYNVTLEKHNAYYANGILVFNCLTYVPDGTQAAIADVAAPVMVRGPTPYPQFQSPTKISSGGLDPAVRTGSRFEVDFSRDW